MSFWTKEEEAFLRECWAANIHYSKIAPLLERSKSSVYQKLRWMKLAVRRTVQEPPKHFGSVLRIQRAVAADFNVPHDLFFSNSRVRPAARPRQVAMLLARELTHHSLPNIGRFFRRDHTTILHGIRAARKAIEEDKNLALKVEARALLLQCDPYPVEKSHKAAFAEESAGA